MNLFLRIFTLFALVFTLSIFADEKTPTQEDLDRLLAPIALYPDDLLAMTLMASTYPLEVVEAARWVEKNKKLTGDALTKEVQKQSWDPSVQSLCRTPDVLNRMNENLEWTQKLGNAFLADQKSVMTTVQSLRKKALDSGNLKNSKEMKVDTNTSADPVVIIIESPTPQTVYVPTYNPTVVYGTWWYPYPPYYIYPPAYVYPPGFTFAVGIFVGAAFWGNCHWGNSSVYINHNSNINVNRNNNVHVDHNNNTWKHNPEHRKGVSYPNDKVAQQHNRASDRMAVQSREDFRGQVDSRDFSQMDTAGFKDKASQSDRSQIQNMDRSKFSSSRENAFSNAGNASRTNAVSNRGSFSRSGGRSFGGRR